MQKNLEKRLCERAASEGRMDALKFFMEKSFPFGNKTCFNAIEMGHFYIAVWALKNGAPKRTNIMHIASQKCDIIELEMLKLENCPLSSYCCALAARTGKLENLIWLLKNNCEYDMIEILSEAAQNNHIHILNWARAEKQEFDELVFSSAASCSKIETLEYLKSINCPWDGSCYNEAISGNNQENYKWFENNNCPYEIVH